MCGSSGVGTDKKAYTFIVGTDFAHQRFKLTIECNNHIGKGGNITGKGGNVTLEGSDITIDDGNVPRKIRNIAFDLTEVNCQLIRERD